MISVVDSRSLSTLYDTAEVIVEVLCVSSPTSSPTFFTGDDLIGLPPEFGVDTLPSVTIIVYER
jgi:hypothetical protein